MSNLAMMMGLGSGAGGVAVADVFSTDLYTGNASTQDIVNGLDLSADGGMVWFARRNGAEEKNIFSTNAPNKYLRTTSTAAQEDITTGITAYNTDGFSLGNWNNVNGSGDTMVSWSWKKASKWFDIVEYTGTGAAQTISHSLGSEVGMIFIKQTSTGLTDWSVYHRSLGGTKNLRLDDPRAEDTNIGYFNDTDATSTEFTVGYLGDFNSAGKTYIAYLFAHNENLTQCGSYTGNGSTTGPEIDLGWQPQWVMIKNTSTAADWYVLDAKRGLNGDAIDDPYLRPNLTNAESSTNILKLTATGFQLNSAGLTGVNRNLDNYIYMAIKAED
jgi:hypothetical protein